jgi:hypothetical protein
MCWMLSISFWCVVGRSTVKLFNYHGLTKQANSLHKNGIRSIYFVTLLPRKLIFFSLVYVWCKLSVLHSTDFLKFFYLYNHMYLILWRVYPLLGNDSVNTFPQSVSFNRRTSITKQRTSKHTSLAIGAVFLCGPCWGLQQNTFRRRDQIENSSRKWRVEFRDASLPGYEYGSNWIESSLRNWQSQDKGKKGLGRWQEDFMCNLKL